MGLLDALRGGQDSPLARLLAPEVAMPMASALMGGGSNMQNLGAAFGAGGQAFGQIKEQKRLTAQTNKTRQFFVSKGLTEYADAIDMGLSPAETYKAYLADIKAQPPKGTSDMQEYEVAKQQGFPGSFMEYQIKMKEAGRQQVNIDTGVKLPTGYQWNDPNNQDMGVKPIAGGPATQLPTEAAGRLGLANTFLENFPKIREKAASGILTGPIDNANARFNSSSEGAETFRQIQAGVDSLQRMLTGAGMPISEASQYAGRYLPTMTDDANSMVDKLDQLKSQLENVQQQVLKGRGGVAPEAQTPDQGGWQEIAPGVRIRAIP